MKKIILDYCYKLTFLSLYFVTLHPSETRLSKKQDWITFKSLVASGPNKSSETKEQKRRSQITRIFNNNPEFAGNYIDTRDPITIAIQNHDDHSFDLFLKSKIKNKRDRNSLSLPFIFTAAHYGNLYALKKLQQKNPHSVFITKENSQTSILHQALIDNPDTLELHETNGTKRQKEILTTLLKTKGIEKTLFIQDQNGKTPLHLMVSLGFDEEFKTVLTKHKDLIQKNKYLLKIKDNHGLTPIDYAFFSKNIDLLDFIKQFNIENIFSDQQKICLDLLQDKFVPYASVPPKYTDPDYFDRLLSVPLNPADQDYFSKLLIEKSRKGVYLPLVDALVSKGADINYSLATKDTHRPFADNNFMVQALRYNDLNFLKKLKNMGLNLKQSDYKDNTALHHYFDRDYNIKTEILEFLIANEVNVNIKNRYGETPLHKAAQKQQIEGITILIKNNADINSKDNEGYTPLHVSISSSFISIDTSLLEVLINNNADINAQNNKGNTPLHLILSLLDINQDTAIDFLLKKGANVQLKNLENKTPLHVAIENSNPTAIELLIKYYTDDQLEDIFKDFSDEDLDTLTLRYGKSFSSNVFQKINQYLEFKKKFILYKENSKTSILHQALIDNSEVLELHETNETKGKKEILTTLLKTKGIEKILSIQDQNGKTPLHLMVSLGFNEEFKTVLTEDLIQKNKYLLKIQDNDGLTPIDYAFFSKNIDLLNFINQFNIKNIFSDKQKICLDVLQDKLVPNASWSLNPTDPDYFSKLLIETSRKGVYLPLVDALLSKGADINYYDARLVTESTYNNFANNSFIGRALRSDDLNLLKKLKNKGLNLKQSDSQDNTVLHHYFAKDCNIKTEILEFLISNEINVNAKNKYGQTPLHMAIWMTREEAIAILIKNNADINSKDNEGNTPLHVSTSFSCAFWYTSLLEVLINNNADINAQNNQGDTPLHSASEFLNVSKCAAINLLLKNGANVQLKNLEKKTPLHIAIEKLEPRSIELLMKYYTDDQLADIFKDSSDKDLDTLILRYGESFSPNMRQKINKHLEFKKKFTLYKENSQASILHQALIANPDILELYETNGTKGQKEILTALLKTKGIEKTLSIQDQNGKTPLHLMVSLGFDEEFKTVLTEYKDLIQKNKNLLKIQDNDGLTPIDYAFFSKNIDLLNFINQSNIENIFSDQQKICLDVLQDKFVPNASWSLNPTDPDYLSKLLIETSRKGVYLPLVDALLSKGADINYYDARLVTESKYNAFADNSFMIQALKSNDLNLLKKLQNRRLNLKQSDYENNTALHHYLESVYDIKTEILEFLISNEVNVNAKNKYGQTPLHMAIWMTREEAITILINNNADINAQNNQGDTPLHSASRCFNVSKYTAINLLLKKGANVQLKNLENKTALHIAIEKLEPSSIELLIKYYTDDQLADIFKDSSDKDLDTLILRYGKSFSSNVFQKIKQHLESKNKFILYQKNSKTSILHQALIANPDILKLHETNETKGQKEILTVLLKTKGIEETLSIQDQNGKTPLHLMVSLGFDEEFKTVLTEYKDLIQKNKNLLTMKDNDRLTPIDYAFFSKNIDLLNFINQSNIENIFSDQQKICLDVLQDKFVPNASWSLKPTDKDYFSELLIETSREGVYLPLVDALLSKGANINSKDNEGYTPLHLNIISSFISINTSLLEVLINNNADINTQNNQGNTPLHSILRLSYIDQYPAIDFLLKNGANVQLKNLENKTALHIAIEALNPIAIKFLIKYYTDDQLADIFKDFSDEYLDTLILRYGKSFCQNMFQKINQYLESKKKST